MVEDDVEIGANTTVDRGTLGVDVVIENISMALTQRQEFAAVIQQRGGNLRGLISALREKIKDQDAKNTPSN